MLESTVSELALHALAVLSDGNIQDAIERGRTVASRLGFAEPNDVVCFVLALDSLKDDFARLARSWRGPKTALRLAVERWAEMPLDSPNDVPHNDQETE
jgi:hypothetical protein